MYMAGGSRNCTLSWMDPTPVDSPSHSLEVQSQQATKAGRSPRHISKHSSPNVTVADTTCRDMPGHHSLWPQVPKGTLEAVYWRKSTDAR